MYESQEYALHESIVIVLHFDGTSSVWDRVVKLLLIVTVIVIQK